MNEEQFWIDIWHWIFDRADYLQTQKKAAGVVAAPSPVDPDDTPVVDSPPNQEIIVGTKS